jgi:hypothetical protein
VIGRRAVLSDKSLYLLDLLSGNQGGNTWAAHRPSLTFWNFSGALIWQAPKWRWHAAKTIWQAAERDWQGEKMP